MDEVSHGIHGVGYAENNGVGRVCDYLRGNALYYAGVNSDEFFAGHAGFAGYAGCDYDHVASFGCGVIVGYAFGASLDAEDVGSLHDVHYFAFGETFFDVDEDNFVGNATRDKNVGTGCAYVTGAYNCNF